MFLFCFLFLHFIKAEMYSVFMSNTHYCGRHAPVYFFSFLDVRRELFFQKARRPKDERDD